MKKLDKSELEMSSRQIMAIGLSQQEKLKNSHILVIGAGGIGSSLLPYLVSSGIGEITLFESDIIERSNLGRQILFNQEQIGIAKGAATLNFLYDLNPQVKIHWKNERFSIKDLKDSNKRFDMIIEGSDDAKLKFDLSQHSLQNNLDLLIGALSFRQAHIFYQKSSNNHACYRCIFQNLPNLNDLPTCANEGILSSMPGVIGSMMAYLTINLILEKSNESLFYILEGLSWRNKRLIKQKHCPNNNLH